MKLFLPVLFALLPLQIFSQAESSEVYITPRYPSYGFGDNGIFRFKLNASCMKVPLLYSSYNTEIADADSLYELFYTAVDRRIAWENYLVEGDSIPFAYARILLVRNLNSVSDMILIDEQHSVRIGAKTYRLNEAGIDFFYALMPPDIQLNWISGRRTINTIDLQRVLQQFR